VNAAINWRATLASENLLHHADFVRNPSIITAVTHNYGDGQQLRHGGSVAQKNSQPAGDVNHKPGGRLPLLSTRPAVTPQPSRKLLPISLLGEQRHDGCEQFA